MQLHYSLRAEEDGVVYNIISQEKVDFKITLSIVARKKQTIARVMTEASIELNGSLIYLRGRADYGSTKAYRCYAGSRVGAIELIKRTRKCLDAYIRCCKSEVKHGTVLINEISEVGSGL